MRVNKILLTSIFALILASCSSVATQPPNVTVTSEVTVTSAPTNTPSPTETPISTVDPNAPNEYTRYENGVYYLDKSTEKGNTLIYSYDQEREVWVRPIFNSFLLDLSPDRNDLGIKDQLYIAVTIDATITDEVLLPQIVHVDNVGTHKDEEWSWFLINNIDNALEEQGLFDFGNSLGFEYWSDGSRKLHFDFQNADGSQSWGLWDNTTISVRIRGDFKQLEENSPTNGFYMTKALPRYDKNGVTHYYMVKIWTDNDGNLFCDIAPNNVPATHWTNMQIMEMIMFAPAAVMEQAPDLTTPQSSSQLSAFVLNQDRYKLFNLGDAP